MLAKAMNYLNMQRDKLTVYTIDGRLSISSNLCEHAVRPFVMDRKSWLFANPNAYLYSLMETRQSNGFNLMLTSKQGLTELPATQTLDDIEAM